MEDTPPTPGQIITFYSYKGGTGRSMALANVAYLLAAQLPANSRGVLMIDWDLEAPGLHRYFPERVGRVGQRSSKQSGLIDFLSLADAAFGRRDNSQAAPPNVPTDAADRRESVLRRLPEFVRGTAYDRLFLLRAGRFDDDYPARIRDLQWEDFHARDPGFFRGFRHYLAAHYDYVLIDSRTGLTDTSGICVQQMPEKLVLVFAPNLQNLEGVVDVARRAARFRLGSLDPRPLAIFPLASRIDGTNEYLRRVWRHGGTVDNVEVTGYQQTFEGLCKDLYDLEECDLGGYFDATQLKHDSDYAFGERIAVRTGTTERLSLGYAVADFTRRLSVLSAPWEPLPSEVEVEESKRRAEWAARRTGVLLSRSRWLTSLLTVLGIVTALLAIYVPGLVKSQAALAAVRAADDPLERALLLTSLDSVLPPWGGVDLAKQVAASPVPFAVLRGHEGPILDLAFSPRGSQLATVSTDHTARVWSIDGRGGPLVLRHSRSEVVSVAWSADGNLVTASADGGVLVWPLGGVLNGNSSARIFRLFEGKPLAIAFGRDGEIVGFEPFAIAWSTGDLSSDRRRDYLRLRDEGLRDEVRRVGFSPEREYAALMSEEQIQVWSTSNPGRPEATIPVRRSVDALAVSPSGRLLASAGQGGVTLARLSFGMALSSSFIPYVTEGPIRSLAFDWQGRNLAVGTSSGNVFLFLVSSQADPPSFARTGVLSGHGGAVTALAYSPDGSALATAYVDGTVSLWAPSRKPPSPDLGWSGLLDYLRNQTTACLPPDKRSLLLNESPSDAERRYLECERGHGRAPG